MSPGPRYTRLVLVVLLAFVLLVSGCGNDHFVTTGPETPSLASDLAAQPAHSSPDGLGLINVIPGVTDRALDTATMEETYKKVVNCARGAELATGAKLDFNEPRSFVKAPLSVPPLNQLVAEKLKALGVQEKDIKNKDDFGSSDLGNVAHAYPTVNVVFKIAPDGTPGHSDAMREAAGGSAQDGLDHVLWRFVVKN